MNKKASTAVAGLVRAAYLPFQNACSCPRSWRHVVSQSDWQELLWKSFLVVQPLSRVGLLETPWTATRPASLSSILSRSLHKFTSLELVMPPNHPVLCRPLLLLPSIVPGIRVFSSESILCIRVAKGLELQLQH